MLSALLLIANIANAQISKLKRTNTERRGRLFLPPETPTPDGPRRPPAEPLNPDNGNNPIRPRPIITNPNPVLVDPPSTSGKKLQRTPCNPGCYWNSVVEFCDCSVIHPLHEGYTHTQFRAVNPRLLERHSFFGKAVRIKQESGNLSLAVGDYLTVNIGSGSISNGLAQVADVQRKILAGAKKKRNKLADEYEASFPGWVTRITKIQSNNYNEAKHNYFWWRANSDVKNIMNRVVGFQSSEIVNTRLKKLKEKKVNNINSYILNNIQNLKADMNIFHDEKKIEKFKKYYEFESKINENEFLKSRNPEALNNAIDKLKSEYIKWVEYKRDANPLKGRLLADDRFFEMYDRFGSYLGLTNFERPFMDQHDYHLINKFNETRRSKLSSFDWLAADSDHYLNNDYITNLRSIINEPHSYKNPNPRRRNAIRELNNILEARPQFVNDFNKQIDNHIRDNMPVLYNLNIVANNPAIDKKNGELFRSLYFRDAVSGGLSLTDVNLLGKNPLNLLNKMAYLFDSEVKDGVNFERAFFNLRNFGFDKIDELPLQYHYIAVDAKCRSQYCHDDFKFKDNTGKYAFNFLAKNQYPHLNDFVFKVLDYAKLSGDYRYASIVLSNPVKANEGGVLKEN